MEATPTDETHKRGPEGWERPWTIVYPLPDLLDRQAQLTPDRTFLVLPDERLTFGQLADRAQYFGRVMLGLGVRRGDTVGILLPTMADFVAIMFGALKVGAVPVLMNARFKSRELHHVVTNGDITIIFTATSVAEAVDFPALLDEAFPAIADHSDGPLQLDDAPRLRHVVLVDSAPRRGYLGVADIADAAARGDDADVALRQSRVSPRDVGLIMYTSGTTASPKGAMLSQEALVRQGDLVARTRFGLDRDDALWTPLPLFHIGGMGHVLTAMSAGCTLVHAGHFDADRALRQLRDERCTVATPAFETMWLQVLDHPDFRPDDLDALRLVVAIGVPERLRAMQDRLPNAPIVTTFGGTEATSHLCIALAEDPPETRLTTGGQPLPGIEVRITDPDTGVDRPIGERGEIRYRGWNRFIGYYNEPELTANAIDADGWFHSGDLGRLDADGRLTYVGRIKDMLKVGGENVAAAEVEDYLVTHPAVQIVQVVSAPDAHYTEVPAAFIELKPGVEATESEIIDFCRGQISTFKVPRYVRFLDEWPMSGTKIKKYELRERIAAELTAAGIESAPRITSVRDERESG